MRDWLRRSRCLSLFRLKGLGDAIRAAISCLKIRFQFWGSGSQYCLNMRFDINSYV